MPKIPLLNPAVMHFVEVTEETNFENRPVPRQANFRDFLSSKSANNSIAGQKRVLASCQQEIAASNSKKIRVRTFAADKKASHTPKIFEAQCGEGNVSVSPVRKVKHITVRHHIKECGASAPKNAAVLNTPHQLKMLPSYNDIMTTRTSPLPQLKSCLKSGSGKSKNTTRHVTFMLDSEKSTFYDG